MEEMSAEVGILGGLPAYLAAINWPALPKSGPDRNDGNSAEHVAVTSASGLGFTIAIEASFRSAGRISLLHQIRVLPASARRIVGEQIVVKLEARPEQRILHVHLLRAGTEDAIAIERDKMGAAIIPDDSGAHREFIVNPYPQDFKRQVLALQAPWRRQIACGRQSGIEARRHIAQVGPLAAINSGGDRPQLLQHRCRQSLLSPFACLGGIEELMNGDSYRLPAPFIFLLLLHHEIGHISLTFLARGRFWWDGG